MSSFRVFTSAAAGGLPALISTTFACIRFLLSLVISEPRCYTERSRSKERPSRCGSPQAVRALSRVRTAWIFLLLSNSLRHLPFEFRAHQLHGLAEGDSGRRLFRGLFWRLHQSFAAGHLRK